MREQILKRLKFLDVSHSYHLRRTPDFSGIDNLEVLLLNNCTNLVEVHESVIYLDKLVTLNLDDCNNLRKLPLGIYNLKSRVYLSGCTKLDMVPRLKSPFTVRVSLLISSEVPLRNFCVVHKLLQHKVSVSSLLFNESWFLKLLTGPLTKIDDESTLSLLVAGFHYQW